MQPDKPNGKNLDAANGNGLRPKAHSPSDPVEIGERPVRQTQGRQHDAAEKAGGSGAVSSAAVSSAAVSSAAKNSGIPGGSAVPAAMNAAQDLKQGNISGAVHEGVEAAKSAGGSWLVNFLWYSTLEIFPGALYGLPALTAYMVIGVFTGDPAWHQLAKWQMIVIIILDLAVIILLLVIIVATLYSYCSGISGLVASATSKVGLTPDICSSFQ